ncbi:MAG: glutamine amidotransferase [Proteobacteria bacterium]|nr:glutamine amidotransferase [Pseudomonadota bacterium]
MDTSPLSRPLVIVKAGDTRPDLAATQGDFEHWIARGLGDTTLPLVVLDPRRGDTLPDPQAVAGAVVTGSHAMVSHREAWSEATGRWLALAARAGTPLMGICYGHQLLADALGGRADDHPQGLELGTVTIDLLPEAADDPLFGGLPARFPAHVVHRQSALQLPAGAVRLASNAWEPNQAFRIGDRAWGVQFHPEFDDDAMRGYVDTLAAGRPDAQALRAQVRPTPEAASLLRRFAELVERREATRSAAEATAA